MTMMDSPTYVPPKFITGRTDPANAPVSKGVMLALLPMTTDWCKNDLPHMTLVYCGTTDDLKPGDFNELAKDASMLAALSAPVQVRVTGVEQFGETPEDKVDALRLQPTPELLAMRRAVESWNSSKFPFKPHATIGPVGTIVDVMPRALAFDRLYVGWGDECIIFRLNRPQY